MSGGYLEWCRSCATDTELDGGSKQRKEEEGNWEVVARKRAEAPNNNNRRRKRRKNKRSIAGRSCLKLDFLLDIVLFSTFMPFLFFLYVYKKYVLV
jgi:hypothetical protein